MVRIYCLMLEVCDVGMECRCSCSLPPPLSPYSPPCPIQRSIHPSVFHHHPFFVPTFLPSSASFISHHSFFSRPSSLLLSSQSIFPPPSPPSSIQYSSPTFFPHLRPFSSSSVTPPHLSFLMSSRYLTHPQSILFMLLTFIPFYSLTFLTYNSTFITPCTSSLPPFTVFPTTFSLTCPIHNLSHPHTTPSLPHSHSFPSTSYSLTSPFKVFPPTIPQPPHPYNAKATHSPLKVL